MSGIIAISQLAEQTGVITDGVIPLSVDGVTKKYNLNNLLLNGSFYKYTANGNGSTSNFEPDFTILNEYSVLVTVGGVYQHPLVDYEVVANVVSFTTAPVSGTNNIVIRNMSSASLGDIGDFLALPIDGENPRTLNDKFNDRLSVKDFDIDLTGATDSTDSFTLVCDLSKEVILNEGTVLLDGTIPVNGTKLIGEEINSSIIDLTTAITTDYGLHTFSNSRFQDLTINHTCDATGTVNGRSNCSILMGAALSSSDEICNFTDIKNVKVVYTDNGTFSGNTVAGFGNVSDIYIENLSITTNSATALQFHWGYNAASTRTNHPRRIKVSGVTAISSNNDTNAIYLSGCHDILVERCLLKDMSQGVIVGTGDVGGGKDPQNESVDLIMGNIRLVGITVENAVNEAFLLQGASFILSPSNDRWIAADYYTTGISIEDCRVIKEVNSTNNTAVYIEHLRNVNVKNMTVGLKSGFQDTDTTEAFTLLASNDCIVEAKTNCVVALNAISGKNNHFTLNHVNSDIDNTTSQNGVAIRGAIIEAIVDQDVAINDDVIIIRELTCDIHKGMKFFRAGVFFEFDGHAALDSVSSRNLNVAVPIKPAPAAIGSGGTILQYYCAHDITIDGKIEGMNKGIRIISSDARVPYNITIDAEFKDNVVADIEAPLGIEVKYKDTYMYDDAGGTMTILNGEFSPDTVIRYKKYGINKIGYSKRIPESGDWLIGDYLHNDNIGEEGIIGWKCTASGSPGTWLADYIQLESDTWTPVLYGQGTAGSPTYSLQAGHFILDGKIVEFSCDLVWSDLGGLVGAARISGLPFEQAGTEYRAGSSVTYYNGLNLTLDVAGAIGFNWYINGDEIVLSIPDVNTIDPTTNAITHLGLTTAGSIYIRGSYQIA